MPQTAAAQITNLPPPYSGEYNRLPIVTIQDPYCQILENFNVNTGAVTLRKGNSKLTQYTSGAGFIHIPCIKWVDTLQSLLLVTADDGGAGEYKVRNYTAGTTLTTVAGYTGDPSASFVMSTEFNNYLYFFGEYDLATTHKGIYYTGAVWATAPYTFTGTFYPILGESHRNRMYLVHNGNTQEIAYGGVDAVTGATTTISLASVLPTLSPIYFIKSFSISDTESTKNLLAVGTRSGHVIVYEGSYPAAADWTIVGRFKIPEVLYYGSVIDYNGDGLIVTRNGLISLRDLFLKGPQGASDQSLSAPISVRWKEIMNTLYTSAYNDARYTRSCWDESNNRIIISFYLHSTFGTNGGFDLANHFLVYDVERQAWMEHVGCADSSGAIATAYGDGSVYFAQTDTLYKKEGKSTYQDDLNTSGTQQYTFRIRSAPIPQNRTRNMRLTGVEFISSGDFYPQTNIRLRGDLGRVTSGNTVVPSQGTGLAKPLVSVGIDATYIQYEIEYRSGSVPSSGMALNGVNLHFEQGGAR